MRLRLSEEREAKLDISYCQGKQAYKKEDAVYISTEFFFKHRQYKYCHRYYKCRHCSNWHFARFPELADMKEIE